MSAARNPSSIVRVDGRDFAIREIAPAAGGRSTVLVFLHEGLGCVGMWKDFPDALVAATGCPALIYDRLGHGGSGAEDGARDSGYFEHEAFAVLPALLAACGVRDPIFVGHSDGGTIALLHAGREPVRGVITEAAHVYVEPESLAGVAAAQRAWRETNLPDRLARYHGDGTPAMFRAWADMWSASWFRDWNIEAALGDIECPVLAIQGQRDDYGTEAQLTAIARGVSGRVETCLVPECGHSPHIDARAAVLARMGEFVLSLV